MTARKITNRTAKSSLVRKRRQAQKQSNTLNFETLEARQLLAAITVGNATDILSATADTSSIAALVASDGGDGISLREAITAANNTAGEDAITFDGSVFTGDDDNLIRLTQGQLEINEDLIIDGSSVGGVVITGDANGDDITVAGTNITNVSASFGQFVGAADDLLDDNSRVLNFTGSSGYLELEGLTITGGRSTNSGESGGGISSSGILSLTNSTVSGNSTTGLASDGGGIFSFNGVSLNNSDVSGNSTAGYLSFGGGISNFQGAVLISNSTVNGNSAANSVGGGIVNGDGDVTLIGSNVSGNSGERGGGIVSDSGTISLTNSAVSGNSAIGSSDNDGNGSGIFSNYGGSCFY